VFVCACLDFFSSYTANRDTLGVIFPLRVMKVYSMWWLLSWLLHKQKRKFSDANLQLEKKNLTFQLNASVITFALMMTVEMSEKSFFQL